MKYIFADMKKIALILTLLIGTTAFGNETPGFEFCINGKMLSKKRNKDNRMKGQKEYVCGKSNTN